MQLPLAHLDASVIEEVPLVLWRKVFEAVGWPASVAGKKGRFTHSDVLEAFERDEPTDDLLLALEALHSLGTEAGRDAIFAAMSDRHVLPQALPTGSGEREFAIHLFLAQRTNAALAEVFARAQAEVEEGADQRRYNEFMGKGARVVANLRAREVALRDATKHYCQAQDLGDHVHVRCFEDDGDYVFHVIRSHHTKKPLAVVPGRAARATIEYRPVHGDILRYDGAVGRLRVAVRAASMVEFYRRTLGQVLFDDSDFFTGDPVCDLRALQERRRDALEAHDLPGIGRVRMTECLWERGDRDLLHIRSSDCFRHIEYLRLPLEEGVLLQAKLKLQVVGRSTRPVTVNIRVPSRIEVSNKIHERLVDEYLAAIGVVHPGSRSTKLDLWSLHPWRHPESAWRALFGSDTDALVTQGVLVPVRLESVADPVARGAGRVLAAHPMKPGELYGVSRMPEIPSRSVTETDVDGLELKPDALRQYVRSQWHLSGSEMAWNGHELLDLGELEVGAHRLHLTYALRQPPSGTGDRVRARVKAGTQPVILIPRTAAGGSELAEVLLGDPLPSRQDVVRGAIAAAGLTEAVPALFTSPENTRLVVDTRLGKVWFDGVEVPALRPETHPFMLVEAVARACPRAVPKTDLSSSLSSSRVDGDTSARQAKSQAVRLIRAATAAAGRALEPLLDPFPSMGGSYRCVVSSYVV